MDWVDPPLARNVRPVEAITGYRGRLQARLANWRNAHFSDFAVLGRLRPLILAQRDQTSHQHIYSRLRLKSQRFKHRRRTMLAIPRYGVIFAECPLFPGWSPFWHAYVGADLISRLQMRVQVLPWMVPLGLFTNQAHTMAEHMRDAFQELVPLNPAKMFEERY